MASTGNSPQVVIQEFDSTVRGPVDDQTNVWVPGFTAKGPVCEPIALANMSDYEIIYGQPETKAEFYHYWSTSQVVAGGGNAVVTRLPYGSGSGETTGAMYSALVYPVSEDTTQTVVTKGYRANQLISADSFGPILSAQLPFSSDIEEDEFINSEFYVSAINFDAGLSTSFDAVTGQDCTGYALTEPVQVKLTQEEYDQICCGGIAWNDQFSCDKSQYETFDPVAWGNAGLIVLDESKSTTPDKQEGFYVTISDNYCIADGNDYVAVRGVRSNFISGGNWTVLDGDTINFALTGEFGDPGISISEVIFNAPNEIGGTFETERYKDSVILALWKLRRVTEGEGLKPILIESHIGSLNADRVQDDENGIPKTFFLENVVGNDSNNLKVVVNPTITQAPGWCQPNGLPDKSVRVHRPKTMTDTGTLSSCDYGDNLYSLGCHVPKRYAPAKDIGNLPLKLKNCMKCIEDPNFVDIDLSVESGLGTIWTTVKNDRDSWITGDQADNSFTFNDEVFLDVKTDLGQNPALAQPNGGIGDDYEVIFNCFEDFASNIRLCNGGAGHLHLADPLRHIFIQGRDCKVAGNLNKSSVDFQRCIYWPLQNLYQNANSTYVTIAGNWAKTPNLFTGGQCWVPGSGSWIRNMVEVDRTSFPWIPAAGFNRGIAENITDIAYSPRLRDRDLLQKIKVNPLFFDRTYGFVWFNQLTSVKANTSLKFVSVRRLLLTLEKQVAEVAKTFLFEQNTIFTRTQFRNQIVSFFEVALQNQGLEDYEVVVGTESLDDRENGCLTVDMYIKPTPSVQKIKLNFRLTRLSGSFNELIV